MSPEDEKYIKEIFAFFYPDMGLPDSISPAAGDLAAQMLKETIEGSKAMDDILEEHIWPQARLQFPNNASSASS